MLLAGGRSTNGMAATTRSSSEFKLYNARPTRHLKMLLKVCMRWHPATADSLAL
jgi:hypothetical protein